MGFPSRIVCLSEATTEILYRLGREWDEPPISGIGRARAADTWRFAS